MDDALYRPRFKARDGLLVKIRHVALDKLKRAPREHHAETVGGVGRILLADSDAPMRKAPLNQQRKQQAGRAGADNGNFHGGQSGQSQTERIYVAFPRPALIEGLQSFQTFQWFKTS